MALLELLLRTHPLWPSIRKALTKGVQYPLARISCQDRRRDIAEALSRGNHKSAQHRPEKLVELLTSDVSSGFALPIPTSAAYKIPDLVIAPVGIASQTTINEKGELTDKDRLTHDQTFQFKSGKSLNSRVDKEALTPVLFGHCFQRLLHYIIAVRIRHPTTRIYMLKTDWNRAFRRASLSAPDAAASSCLATNDIILLSLRMTFGGRPNPSCWSDFSEAACDLINALQTLPHLDLAEFRQLIPAPIPEKKPLPNNVPFATAKALSVDIEPNDCGKADNYIDDAIGIVPDFQDNVERLSQLMPLVICLLGRPLHKDEPLPRKWLLSLTKHLAEGCPEETKINLGWLFDTRRLLVSLPPQKFQVWHTDIHTVLLSGVATSKVLESILGRLEHVACVCRPFRHFLGRLHWFSGKCSSTNKNHTTFRHKIPRQVREDLELAQLFLQKAKEGFSMNNLVHRAINVYLRSDAAFLGLGFACWHCGRAHRIQIPWDRQMSKPQNFLEFLGACVALREHPPFEAEACVCSQTDNTNAEGWLHKTNFHDGDTEKLNLARWLGNHQLEHNYCLYSQWFPGDTNTVTDCLSRDFHLSDSELTTMLQTHCPEQLPDNFQIYPVSQETLSWVYSMLPLRPENEPLPPAPIRSTLGRSVVGSNSPTPMASATTPTWNSSTPLPASDSSAPSAKPSNVATTPKAGVPITHSWVPPPKNMSTKWHRPLWTPTDPIPDSIALESIQSFYRNNTEATPISTQPPPTKKR
jgi:hypothetical protein